MSRFLFRGNLKTAKFVLSGLTMHSWCLTLCLEVYITNSNVYKILVVKLNAKIEHNGEEIEWNEIMDTDRQTHKDAQVACEKIVSLRSVSIGRDGSVRSEMANLETLSDFSVIMVIFSTPFYVNH